MYDTYNLDFPAPLLYGVAIGNSGRLLLKLVISSIKVGYEKNQSNIKFSQMFLFMNTVTIYLNTNQVMSFQRMQISSKSIFSFGYFIKALKCVKHNKQYL